MEFEAREQRCPHRPIACLHPKRTAPRPTRGIDLNSIALLLQLLDLHLRCISILADPDSLQVAVISRPLWRQSLLVLPGPRDPGGSKVADIALAAGSKESKVVSGGHSGKTQ